MQRARLGFLSEGAFFGEAAVLADESGRELRRRTLQAVTDSELCYINREDVIALRGEYPELDARLKRFVNVGNIRLTRKNGIGKLFPELSPAETGMTKAQAEAEQRKLVGEYASTYEDMRQVMKTIREDGVANDATTVSLQQLGVDKARQVHSGGGGGGISPTAAGSMGATLPPPSEGAAAGGGGGGGGSTLGNLPRLPDASPHPANDEKLRMVEQQLEGLRQTVAQEIGTLHSKNDAMQDSLQAILRKLNEM